MSDAGRLVRRGAIAAGADGALWVVFGAEGGERSAIADDPPCSGCRACPGASRSQRLALTNLCAADEVGGTGRPGDPLELSIDAAGLVRAAGWAFGAPLTGLVAGAWMGSAAMGEGASIAFGIVGLSVGLAWLLRSGRGLVSLLGLRIGLKSEV
jgi:positive regulator of sigma E activity